MRRGALDFVLVGILAAVGVALLLIGLLVGFGPEEGRIVAENSSGALVRWLFIGIGAAVIALAIILLILVVHRRRRVADPDHPAEHHLVESFLERPKPLKPGIFHLRSGDAMEGYRVHLRVEPNGNGTLVVNAAKIIHLNQTAAEYAKLIVEERTARDAVREITARYDVPRKIALADYEKIRDIITELGRGGDICPVTYLDLDRYEPFSVKTFAPYRVDLVLTYDCDNECGHCYVPPGRSGMTQLTKEDWRRVMERLWEAGVPHVTFTGGEATLYPHLRDLIEYAEDIGLVTGLLTNGRILADREYLAKLVEVGLDHVQITLESHDEAVHDDMVGAGGAWKETVRGIKNALEQPLYVLTNTTITRRNADGVRRTVEFIAGLGLTQVAANGMIHSGRGKGNPDAFTETELAPHVEEFFDAAVGLGLNFLWYTPTRYEDLNPIELGVGIKTCSAAKYNLAVEPNGDVLPCQSYFEALGNILTDDWDSIWNHPLAVSLRNRDWVPDECRECAEFPLCGGGCPLLLQEDGEITCSAPA
ncbi:PqqD family peptide modification chaperone [bacterium]|nr:PqqD family peptide modification chaperone [bacterium]